VITGSAQVTRDADWIMRNVAEDAHVTLTDVTGAWTVLSVMGPNSRKLLQKVSKADFSNEAFPFATIREIGVGYATVYASRRTYMGELGWELYVPAEFAVTAFETLHGAGAEVGLRDMGYYAIEGLRIEKAYRAWGRELTPDDNPWQAGLGWAVKLDKPGGFIGRQALIDARAKPLARRPMKRACRGGRRTIPWARASRVERWIRSARLTRLPSTAAATDFHDGRPW
jgi:sarcosine dehydrogenase